MNSRTARHAGTRALIVLILASLATPVLGVGPAEAAAPTVGAFVPLSGAPGVSVTIAGNGFADASPATAVEFNGTPAAFTLDDEQTITAIVPEGAETGPISVTDAEGTDASTLSFIVTAPTAPEIAAFLPVSGPVKTAVTIEGTGFSGATDVDFADTSAKFTVVSDTEISTRVPKGATTGPITVVAPGGTAESPIDFTVTGATRNRHDRTVTLKVTRSGIAKGRLSAGDGYNACAADKMVKIQRRRGKAWKVVGSDRTDANGRFARRVGRAPKGTYRAIAPRTNVNGGGDVCARDVSPTRRLR